MSTLKIKSTKVITGKRSMSRRHKLSLVASGVLVSGILLTIGLVVAHDNAPISDNVGGTDPALTQAVAEWNSSFNWQAREDLAQHDSGNTLTVNVDATPTEYDVITQSPDGIATIYVSSLAFGADAFTANNEGSQPQLITNGGNATVADDGMITLR